MKDSTGLRTGMHPEMGVTSPVLSDGSASFTPSGEWRGGVKTAYHGGLKSFDTQTNAAQSVVGQRLTDAFGNQISGSGVWKGRFAYGGPYGYQEDPDTGLRLLGHRYYDSSTGRFLTRDPIKDGRNWYAYCDNNPVSSLDADGLKPRALTDVEKQQVLNVIWILWLTGQREQAELLKKMLENGQIFADDENFIYEPQRNAKTFPGDGGTYGGKTFDSGSPYILLNPAIFQAKSFWLLCATLLHESIHARQIVEGKMDKKYRVENEIEAYDHEWNWLRSLPSALDGIGRLIEDNRKNKKRETGVGGVRAVSPHDLTDSGIQ